MKKSFILGAILIVVLAGFSHADEATSRARVKELMEVTNAKAMVEQVREMTSKMMDQYISQADLPPEGKELFDKLKTEILDWYSGLFSWEKMQDFYYEIYSKTFTEKELEEIIAIYKTPIGKKMITKMPELMQASVQKSQEIAQKNMPEFMERLQKIVNELSEKYGE